MRLSGSGNLGLGTLETKSKLTVGGTIEITSGGLKFADGTTQTTAGGGGGGVTSVGTGTGLTGGPITGTGTISIASGGVGATQLANGAVTTAKLADNISINTTGAITAETMMVSGTDDTQALGITIANLGTGADVGANCLRLVNDASKEIRLGQFSSSAGGFASFGYLSSDSTGLGLLAGQSSPIMFGQNSGGPGGPNWRMMISDTGKVGIGTTEPASRLTVAGTVEITAGGLKFADGTVQMTAGGGASLPSGSAGQTLRHDGGNWVANNIITNTGTAVGIGTNEAVNASLDVNGNIRIRGSGDALPAASAAYRGVMYLLQGTPDKLFLCMQKSTAGQYQWVLVSRGD